ncbi:TrmH family RNA methyltransferase [Candidatus Coxiella mudrowiae]|uniref:TrmH family RNA methyltransferase n=1 Tax=Candidatus Coxiella mudrowiae TaxID=2054173 RepID=UPI001F294EC8
MVNLSHPGNIGATVRAMKNMGFSRLYLVQPEFFRMSRLQLGRQGQMISWLKPLWSMI